MQNLLLIAIGPSLAILIFFYMLDKYDHEPIGLLIKIFIGGMLSVIPIVMVEMALESVNGFPDYLGILYTSFVVAGLTEEFFKRKVVMVVAFKDSHFDEKLDGIIYAVFASLGMATVENVLYVVGAIDPVSVGMIRGIITVPMHMLFGVTMGYYLSLAKFAIDETDRRKFMRKSLWHPIMLHGIFDFLLLSENMFFLILVLPFVFWSWRNNYKKLVRYYEDSKKHHYEMLNKSVNEVVEAPNNLD